MTSPPQSAALSLRHRFIDRDAGFDGWGAVAVGDFDGDGRPEVSMGGKGGGFLFVFDFDADSGGWRRHEISRAFSPQVGAASADLDGDGRPELVLGEWGTRLFHARCIEGDLDRWSIHDVYAGLDDPHDILAARLVRPDRDSIVVREKGGRLLLFNPPSDPSSRPWHPRVIAENLAGDGTLAARLRPGANGTFDLVTARCWFENVAGDGSRWIQHALVPPDWDFHPETRLAFGDLGKEGPVLLVAESEVRDARVAALRPGTDVRRPWHVEIVVPREAGLCALHTLALADLDGDGCQEVVSIEMENGKTDGITRKPRWWMLKAGPGGWSRDLLLDLNLGGHCGVVADFDGDGLPEIVSKTWRANAVNGAGGRNHVDHAILAHAPGAVRPARSP